MKTGFEHMTLPQISCDASTGEIFMPRGLSHNHAQATPPFGLTWHDIDSINFSEDNTFARGNRSEGKVPNAAVYGPLPEAQEITCENRFANLGESRADEASNVVSQTKEQRPPQNPNADEETVLAAPASNIRKKLRSGPLKSHLILGASLFTIGTLDAVALIMATNVSTQFENDYDKAVLKRNAIQQLNKIDSGRIFGIPSNHGLIAE